MDSSGWSNHPRRRRDGAARPHPGAAVPPLRGPAARPSAGARSVSRSPADPVKTPTPRSGGAARSYRKSTVTALRYAVAIALAILAGVPVRAAPAASEPLCEWLTGIGIAAQALAEEDYALAEGAARRALAARPHGAAAGRAHAALGLALLSRDAPVDAAESLETALGSPVPARAHLAFARGEALIAAGNAPRAARLFSEASTAAADDDLALTRRARLREAEALLAAGLATEALPGLEELLRTDPDDPSAGELRLAMARALRAVGDSEQAAATFRSLWLELPDRPEGVAAGATLATWRAAGGPVPLETGQEHALRADRLVAAGRPEWALEALDAAGRAEEPAADAERVALLRATALLALGRHGEAERLALQLAGARSPEVWRGARLVLARATARAGRLDEAARFYLDVAGSSARVPGLPDWRQQDIGDEAAFLAAWLPYDAGDFQRAAVTLQAFARANPRSRRAEDALWFAAWSRYRLGAKASAARAFAALSRGPIADAALYWRARLARSRARQRALYRSAYARGAGGWYSLLARARLAELGAVPERPRVRAARPLPEVKDGFAAGRLSVAVELLGLGLRSEALAELRSLARSGRVRPAAALVAQLAAFADDPEVPLRVARDHLLPSRRVLRWAYPEPHRDALLRSSRGFGVDPALVLGVMRRESRFRETARSDAGAEGLLQLRPVTAERLATLLGVPVREGDGLHDPEASIALGAHYLGLLVARFGDPAIALAAYNAGPAAVEEWLRARAGMPLDAWIESIPFRETREYVKTVFVQWDTYRDLAGEPPSPVDPGLRVRPPHAGVRF